MQAARSLSAQFCLIHSVRPGRCAVNLCRPRINTQTPDATMTNGFSQTVFTIKSRWTSSCNWNAVLGITCEVLCDGARGSFYLLCAYSGCCAILLINEAGDDIAKHYHFTSRSKTHKWRFKCSERVKMTDSFSHRLIHSFSAGELLVLSSHTIRAANIRNKVTKNIT